MSKFVVSLAFVCVSLVHAATPLEDAMSQDQRQAAGLHKLSEVEKTYLSDWLAGRERSLLITNEHDGSTSAPNASTQIQLRVLDAEDRFGLEQVETPTITMMKDRLKTDFDGWHGDTKFHLANGQVWQQRVGGQYNAPQRSQPEVVIEKSRFGYYLKVVETGRMVGVKRIR